MDAQRLYGLVGHPLGHSFSQRYFRDFFEREGLSTDYLNFDLDDISEIGDVLERYPQLCGFNVTVPYKQDIMPYLDHVDVAARRIGAVNVVRVKRSNDGPRLIGYNSDYLGFASTLAMFALDAHADRALILGTGGASMAVKEALHMRNITFATVSRSAGKADYTYTQLHENPALLAQHRIIINATPLGTFPNDSTYPDLPYHAVTCRHIALDLVYNPAITQFLSRCAAQGAAICNGLHMLLRQAQISWEIWNNQHK